MVQKEFSVSVDDTEFVISNFNKALGRSDVASSQVVFKIDGIDNVQPTYDFVDVSTSSKYSFKHSEKTSVEKLETF